MVMKFKNNIEADFFDYLLSKGYAQRAATSYVRCLRRIKSVDVLIKENLADYITDYEKGANENLNKKAHNAYSCALKRFKEYVENTRSGSGIMELEDFIGKVVIRTSDKKQMILTEITSPKIGAKTVELGTHGHPHHYCWETIGGDPFSNGHLVFEDTSLAEPFKKAYDAYCRTEDAYWESYGYWMRKS